MAEVVDVVPADSLVRRRDTASRTITTPGACRMGVDVSPPVGAKLDAIGDSIKAMVPEGLTLEDGASSADEGDDHRVRQAQGARALQAARRDAGADRCAQLHVREEQRAARLWRAQPRTKRTRAA